jgi:polysaccharide chain length determinant protein (PEP-CTERM system associated)
VSYDDEDQLQVPTNYIAALSRYKYYLILAIVLMLGVSAAVVAFIPAIYRSESIVLVETQQIPDELVKSTVTSIAAERIQVIKQRVMTRDKLLAIAKKYPSLEMGVKSSLVSELVTDMREKITVDLITGTNNHRRQAATIAFKVAFDALSPRVAQAVTNDLVTLFLDENVKARTERATETTEFLRGESSKLQAKLAETEKAIADYKQQHKEALPEHLELYMAMLERAHTSRVEIRRQMEAERNQRSLYELQSGVVDVGNDAQLRLKALEREYEQLSARYKESHPDLVNLKEEIESIKQVSSGKSTGNTLVAQKVAAVNGQLRLLAQQLNKTNQQIEELEAKVLKIPQIERGLLSLNRDYEAVKAQYDKIVSNTMQAQMAESLEQGRKAERFSILEPPLLPDQPYKPDRKKLFAIGAALSFLFPFGLVIALAFLDKTVRGAAAVETITGHAPLVVIGVINTPGENAARKKRQIKIVLGLIFVSVLAVVLLHLVVMPLDLVLYKLMFKFGLS